MLTKEASLDETPFLATEDASFVSMTKHVKPIWISLYEALQFNK